MIPWSFKTYYLNMFSIQMAQKRRNENPQMYHLVPSKPGSDDALTNVYFANFLQGALDPLHNSNGILPLLIAMHSACAKNV